MASATAAMTATAIAVQAAMTGSAWLVGREFHQLFQRRRGLTMNVIMARFDLGCVKRSGASEIEASKPR
jgi:hypothetical protein